MTRTALALVLTAGTLSAQVSFDRVLRASEEPQNWLSYSGGFQSQRYSALNEIHPDNVKNLELKWVFQARSTEKVEATALVVDGVLYTVQAPNDVVAIDAAKGRVFGIYPYVPATKTRPCCGRVNRGRQSWATRYSWPPSTRI
jgi:glucose dehydrogenase